MNSPKDIILIADGLKLLTSAWNSSRRVLARVHAERWQCLLVSQQAGKAHAQLAASRIIISSTWLTRFPPRTPNYRSSSKLFCRKESSERVNILLYMHINIHIWHVNNSCVCFPNWNPRCWVSKCLTAKSQTLRHSVMTGSLVIPPNWDFYP